MARPRIRKLDSSLDLSKHLFSLEQLPRPWRTEDWFGRVAPLEVEVGSGKGLFLRSAAVRHPEVDYLGIEVVRSYAQLIAAYLVRDGIANARIAAADATVVFHEVLPENVLDAVHVYFPDPWWKRRHKKRLLMRESFVRDVERTLKPGGTLHFWTDVEEYFHRTLKLLAAQTALEGPLAVPEPPADSTDYRTHFERRTRLADQPVFRAEFRKP